MPVSTVKVPRLLLLAMICGPFSHAQAPNDAARTVLLARGKVLLTQLKGDPESDALRFREVGGDVAQRLLQEVANHGLENTATIDDWADLHRAYQGLTALEAFRRNPARAAAYAYVNDAFYRSRERNYAAGLTCLQRALDLDREAGQPLYLVYQAMGADLRSLGRLAAAMTVFRQAEQTLPDLLDKTGATLGRDMVATLLAQGKRQDAEQVVEQMAQRAKAAAPFYQAQAGLANADLLFAGLRYAEGIEAVKSALAAVEKTPDASLVSYEATAQLSVAILDGIGQLPYAEALRLAKLADKQIPGLPVQIVPFAQMAIRERRRLAGDLDGLLREDVARVEQARQRGNTAELVASLKLLANGYASLNEMRPRALALEEAVEIEEKTFPDGGVPGNIAAQRSYLNLLNTLGQAYVSVREAGPARRNFDAVLKAVAQFSTASTLASLRQMQEQAVMGKADSLALDDDPDEARALLQKLLLSASADSRPYVLLALGRLERTLNEKPEAAVEYYAQAITALRASRDYPQELATRLTLVRYLAIKAAARVANAHQKALEQLAAGEALAHGMQYADAEWRLDYLGGVLVEQSNAKLAIEHYRRAIGKLDQLRSGLSQQEQRQTFFDDDSVQDLYTRLTSMLAHAGLHADAWQYVERAKARSFLDSLQGRRFAHESGVTPAVAELEKLEKQIADVRLQLLPQNEGMLRAAGREPDVLKRGLADLEAKFTQARTEASLAQSRSGQVLSLQPVPLARIQKSLGPHTALLEYSLLEGELMAFVVTRTGSEQLIWKGDTTKLRRDVLQLRALLADAQSTEWPALLEQVSKTVITPVATKIPKGTKQILIVATSYLNYLPFPVLSLPDGRALVEAYGVSYLPNASALAYLGKGARKGDGLFLGALGDVAVDGMPPLPGTLIETAGIEATYPQAVRVSGAAFTHDVAENALLTADTVHFATHGLLEEEAPLFSAILTSPMPGGPARLSLYEIAALRIRARLVVLSACETGLGKLQGGDEITGMTRTFLTAGADAVVASLWKVSDESTAMLMQEFYRGLSQGLKAPAALRTAALSVRAKYPHPFYWAAFVVTGRD